MMDRDLAMRLIDAVERATAALERLAPETKAKPEAKPEEQPEEKPAKATKK